jgi:hypothetical protein
VTSRRGPFTHPREAKHVKIQRVFLTVVLLCAAAACSEPPTAQGDITIPIPRADDPSPVLPTIPIPGPSPIMIGPPHP